MDRRPPVGFDLETHLFRPGWMAPRIVCASVDTGTGPIVLDFRAGARWLRDALEMAIAGDIVIAGHSVAYDFGCALEHWPELGPLIWRAYDAGGIHCTRTRERLLDIERGSRFAEPDDEEDDEDGEPAKPQRKAYTLEAIALARCDIVLNKSGDWRRSYATLEDTPIDGWDPGAIDYAQEDARAARLVWIDQERAALLTGYASSGDVWRDECGRRAAFAFALQLMKVWGVMVDQDRVKVLRDRLVPKLAEYSAIMRRAGIMRDKLNAKGKYSRNLASMRELIEVAWRGDGRPPLSKKTKKTQTARAVLELCDHPALVAAAEYGRVEKMLSSFVDKIAAAGSMPVHANTDVLGADTGRMSCSGPNLHQQPREPGVRECFKARPGFVFLTCDYDSQEVRGMGEVRVIKLGQSALAQHYCDNPDFDPHSAFAAQALLGISYEEALRRKTAKDEGFENIRQIAKSANLGFQYGMGAAKYMSYARGYGVVVDFARSKELFALYRQHWPDARDLFNLLSNLTMAGDVTAEVPYVGRLRGGCRYTQLGNTWVQGLCADITLSATWEVVKRCYGAPGTEGSALYGCRPVNVPHDEILLEAPEEYAHEAALELEQVMVAAQQELTPHVPARATPALMRWWSKKAAAVFNKDGRYIVWEDRPRKGSAA